MPEPACHVVHIGSASRDLADDDPRGWRLGGGATYSALTTARLGLRTGAIVGVDAAAARAAELDLLRAAGVDLVLVPLDEGPVFRNRETPAGRVQACVVPGRPLPVSPLPERWCGVSVWSFVPVAAELDAEWLSVLPADAFLILGWQGLLRRLEPGHEVVRQAPRHSRLAERADLVGVSRHDLPPETALPGLLQLLGAGARLVVTDGLDGGRMLERASDGTVRTSRYGAVAADRDVDPTGAGDVFLASLVTALVRDGAMSTFGPRSGSDLRFAATAASFVVEAPGLLGVPDLAAVLARLERDPAHGATLG